MTSQIAAPAWDREGEPANAAAVIEDAVEWMLFADLILYVVFRREKQHPTRRRLRIAIANLRATTSDPVAEIHEPTEERRKP